MIRGITIPARGLKIAREVYRDKVLGCWQGKNVGGTLGGPLEEKFGREELFDVTWYPELPEGGIPNDDLELQLIFFQALQDLGPGIAARQLADYWLNCVSYNFDEYGLSKTNLLKGLVPPVSGWHNNWFRHCMGSPIRSEIWACVAPGTPEIAARYAFEDAICDHGGGESVYGEIFNAVVESCAFVESDKAKLTEAGLSAIPKDSLTARAIRRVLELYREGVDWVRTRNIIKDEFFLALAQYSPINMGFQTIGFLYGETFADAICKAVNCGWDTDCTGATVGAMFGIILGAKQLPSNWVAPLRDEISTNLGNGGIRHLRAPTDIQVLTDRVCAAAPRVLRYWNSDTQLTDESSTYMPEFHVNTGWLSECDFAAIEYDLDTVRCTLQYVEDAAILGNRPSQFIVTIKNPHPEKIYGILELQLPSQWQLTEGALSTALSIAGGEHLSRHFRVTAKPEHILDSNRLTAQIDLRERPALPAIPFVLLGGNRWLVSPTLDGGAHIDEQKIFETAPPDWGEFWAAGNELPLEALFEGRPGRRYMLHFIESLTDQEVIFGVSNNSHMSIWLNGTFLQKTKHVTAIRPNQGNGGGDGSNYAEGWLRAGMNQILIRFDRGSQPIEAHFTLGRPDRQHLKCLGHAVLDLRRTLFPWESETPVAS